MILTNYQKEKIGARLKSERLEHGYRSADALSKVLSSSVSATRQTIKKWEKGVTLPDIEQLCALTDLYNCDLQYLLCQQNERRRYAKDISAFTGLSEQAINILIAYKKSTEGVITDHIVKLYEEQKKEMVIDHGMTEDQPIDFSEESKNMNYQQYLLEDVAKKGKRLLPTLNLLFEYDIEYLLDSITNYLLVSKYKSGIIHNWSAQDAREDIRNTKLSFSNLDTVEISFGSLSEYETYGDSIWVNTDMLKQAYLERIREFLDNITNQDNKMTET